MTGGAVSSVKVGLPYLRIGSGGQLVQSMQEQLQRSDFFSGGVDGIFGQQTEQAVRAFQRSRGLDGRAGSFDVGTAPPGAQQLLFMEWLLRVRSLFDPGLVDKLTTRTVVLGRALLDRRLRDRLERDGFLTAFRAHRKRPDGPWSAKHTTRVQ